MEDKQLRISSKITVILVTLSNGLGAIFQLLAGRMIVNPMEYSNMNAILSLQGILTIPSTIFIYIVAKYVAENNNENGKVQSVLVFFEKRALLVAVLVAIFSALFSAKIVLFFNISNQYYLIFLAVITFLVIGQSVTMGYFQGIKNFFVYNIVSVFVQGMKVISLCVAPKNELQLFVILVILIISYAMIFFILKVIERRTLQNVLEEKIKIDKMKLLKYLFAVVIVNFVINMQNNMDILFVKHYLNEVSADYSIAMVFGKSITYFSGALAAVLFPFAVSLKEQKQDAAVYLKKTICLNIGIEGIILAGLAVVGKSFISIVYGDLFPNASDLLVPIGIMFMPIGLITIIINYALALGECKRMLILIMLSVVSECVIVYFFHKTIMQLIVSLMLVFWATFILLLINTLHAHKREARK